MRRCCAPRFTKPKLSATPRPGSVGGMACARAWSPACSAAAPNNWRNGLSDDHGDITPAHQDRHPRHGRRGRWRAGRLDRGLGRTRRPLGANHLGAWRGPAHRCDHLLRRVVSQSHARCGGAGACVGLDALARGRGYCAGFRADGSRSRGAARLGHHRQNHLDCIDPPGLLHHRKISLGRWPRGPGSTLGPCRGCRPAPGVF